jgi:hypothetical protein
LIRVLGIDRTPVVATVLGLSGDELRVRLQDSAAPRYLKLDAAVGIDAPERMLLGEIAASRTEQGETILTITIRHVLTHLSELLRMRNALLGEADSASNAPSATPVADTRMARDSE